MNSSKRLRASSLVATILLIASGSALSASPAAGELPSELQTCEKYNTNYRVMSVKRNGPGKISVEVELENNANKAINLVVSQGGKWAVLVDNNGEAWKYTGQRPYAPVQVPGVKTKRYHNFELLVGGNDIASVSFQITYQITGTFDKCSFSVTNVPVSDKS